ncbi:hypothetical protein V6N12_002879 [Hibiscus sabdariffa]|uniref:Retrotransposon gag domain-containing protein n=1 Tax=Hibiscus sabdariffa TaxID=183260 RepID=A0ABR2EDU8_9ROSI
MDDETIEMDNASVNHPSDAEHWIKDLQRLFVEMNYPVNLKLRAVVSLLRGEALNWLESVIDTVSASQVTWEYFRDKFQDRYVGDEYYEMCRQEFMDLKQNNLFVNAYEIEFLRLVKYGAGLATTEKQDTVERLEALSENQGPQNDEQVRMQLDTLDQPSYVSHSRKRLREEFLYQSYQNVRSVVSTVPVGSRGSSRAHRPIPVYDFCNKKHNGECRSENGTRYRCGLIRA